MGRTFLLAAVVLGAGVAWGQESKDKPAAATDKPDQSAAEKVRDNPNDSLALNTLAGQRFREISGIMEDQPEEALKKLKEFESLIAGIQPDAAAAKTLVSRIEGAIESYRAIIEAIRTPLADLEKKLTDNPDDTGTLQRYWTKVEMQINSLARSEPDEAAKQVEAVKATLAKVTELSKEGDTKRQVSLLNRDLAALDGAIESGRKLAAVIGKDAAPLAVEAWVNGSPLTDDDLKGKVVLLDFWAVWCGPCIATFPHLREWHEKYAGKGLVIIGLTNYHEFDWIEADNRASRVAGTSHEAEQAMLVKFAEHHGLAHRFGIQSDNSMTEYYSVNGIPHVVLIDQQGKVRLMRVGSGEKNAKDIGALIAKLLGEKAAGGE